MSGVNPVIEIPSVVPMQEPAADVWFRLASFPDRTLGNPGLEMFYQGMAAHGVRLTTRLVCQPRWIRDHAAELDGIHVHWPEKIWRGKTRGRLHQAARQVTFARYRAVIMFGRALKAARRLGLQRLWTVHNLEPHDGADWVDRLGYRIAAANSDLIVCYSRAAAADVQALYRPPGTVVGIAHGNYVGIYPPARDRDTVMRGLGLDPGRPMVCCIGIIKRYKGLDVACGAIRTLGGSVQLAICGSPHSADDVAAIRAQMAGLPGVLVARPLSDQEFSDVIAASEAILLPYRKITGSGSLLAAWTQARGVIASDLPLFREMLSAEPGAGQTFTPDDSPSLAAAISAYLSTPGQLRSAAAVRAANFYSWDRTVEPVIKEMRQWKNR
jgi:beta-1,4-mannosyltransferase